LLEFHLYVFFRICEIPRFLFAGTIQGLHNIHGNFNVPNIPGTLTSRNSAINNVPSGGVQQPTGSLSSGRFASNNLPVALSQVFLLSMLVASG
jgi:CCR4-NOT transcription complex subunit 2